MDTFSFVLGSFHSNPASSSESICLTQILRYNQSIIYLSREGKGAETMATELSEKLTLSESVDDPSADGTSLGQLLSEAYRNIPEVRSLYMLYIATDKKKLETSR